jgi:hypothetical protein
MMLMLYLTARFVNRSRYRGVNSASRRTAVAEREQLRRHHFGKEDEVASIVGRNVDEVLALAREILELANHSHLVLHDADTYRCDRDQPPMGRDVVDVRPFEKRGVSA